MNESAEKKPRRLNDPDFRNAEIAMLRAAKKARERAKRFGHGVMIYENGKIVEEQPEADSKDVH
jgi:hypothetical protein